jgi:hypothetical protein
MTVLCVLHPLLGWYSAWLLDTGSSSDTLLSSNQKMFAVMYVLDNLLVKDSSNHRTSTTICEYTHGQRLNKSQETSLRLDYATCLFS